jgi:dUTP pyrophosphatase
MFKAIDGGMLPKRSTKYSAGFDVFANETVQVGAGETKLIGLGIMLDDEEISKAIHGKYNIEQFKASFMLELCLRSSLGVKGLILPNGHGVIDMDYRGEMKMIIHNPITEEHVTWWVDTILNMVGIKQRFNNDNTANYTIKKGDKIGQLILKRHEGILMPESYTENNERDGGFGSTGK